MIIYNYYFAKINDWRSISVYEKRLYLSICRISMTADSMIFQIRAECAWACVHALRKLTDKTASNIAIDIHLEMIWN